MQNKLLKILLIGACLFQGLSSTPTRAGRANAPLEKATHTNVANESE